VRVDGDDGVGAERVQVRENEAEPARFGPCGAGVGEVRNDGDDGMRAGLTHRKHEPIQLVEVEMLWRMRPVEQDDDTALDPTGDVHPRLAVRKDPPLDRHGAKGPIRDRKVLTARPDTEHRVAGATFVRAPGG
jgi:hypothetical protein